MKVFKHSLIIYLLAITTFAQATREIRANGIQIETPYKRWYEKKELLKNDYSLMKLEADAEWEAVIVPLDQKFFNQKLSDKEKIYNDTVTNLSHIEQLAVETEERLFPSKTVTTTIIAASILSPLIVASRSAHRSPITILGTAALLKEYGFHIATAIPIGLLANKIIKLIHAPCEAEKEILIENYKKIAVEAALQSKKDFAEFRQEIMRETEQNRMNGVDALLKVDALSRDIEKRLKALEKLLDKTEFKKEVTPLKHELEKQHKEIEKLRKQKDPMKQDVAKIHNEIKALQKSYQEVLSTSNEPSTNDTFSNNAISTLSQQIQKALENQRVLEELLRQQGITPVATPSNSQSCTLRQNLQVPTIPISSSLRRRSISGVVPPLNSIAELFSTPNSDVSDSENDETATPSPKTLSRRRRSVF